MALSSGRIVMSMVVKHATPPITFDIGSAINTPFTPRPPICGRISVRGTTMTAFRSSEKKMACLFFVERLEDGLTAVLKRLEWEREKVQMQGRNRGGEQGTVSREDPDKE